MKLTQSLLLLAFTLTTLGASAQWQWVDKDGKRVFSDRAPGPEIPVKNILKQPGVRAGTSLQTAPDGVDSTGPQSTAGASGGITAQARPAASAPKLSKVDKELEAKKKQTEDAEAAKRKAEDDREAKAKIESCARAKHAKATFDSGIRVSRINAAGENEVMDEGARAQEVKRIQSVVSSDCK